MKVYNIIGTIINLEYTKPSKISFPIPKGVKMQKQKDMPGILIEQSRGSSVLLRKSRNATHTQTCLSWILTFVHPNSHISIPPIFPLFPTLQKRLDSIVEMQ